MRLALVPPVEPQAGRAIGHSVIGTDLRVPALLLRSVDETCSDRIPLDVATDREEVLAGFDRKGFEAPLIDSTCSDRVPMGGGPTVAYA